MSELVPASAPVTATTAVTADGGGPITEPTVSGPSAPVGSAPALAELLGGCDPAGPPPHDLSHWDAAPAVGRELL